MIKAVIAAISSIVLASCASAPQVTPAVIADLAPSGKMRVGINHGNVLFAARDAKTGQYSGITVDLAHELGRRLGVPVELVGYPAAGQLTGALKSDAWDVAFIAFEPARAAEIHFAAPFAEVESSYLVPAGSSLRNAADADRAGIRIAVGARGGNDLFLSRTIKHAQLVRIPGGTAKVFARFVEDKLDALAGLKPALLAMAEKLPGSRVLEGRYTVIGYSAGVPRGRDAGARYLAAFIEDAKVSGFVARAIERNGIRGVTVAPPAAGASTVQIGGGY
jgi:polar amino acid transport system substrate-binding protein